ncbi:MAG: putative lipid II flippase FtsW [bacterium]
MEKLDKLLLVPFAFLVFLGSVMVFSASANVYSTGNLTLFFKHILWVTIGCGLLLFTLIIPVEAYQKYIYLMLFVVLILLVILFIPGVGRTVKGAKRWISFSFIQFQPSFLAKWVLLVFIASSLSKKVPEKIKSFKKGILPYLIILGVLGILFLKEPDYGGFVVITAMSVIMLIIAGTRIRYWFLMGLIAAPFFVYMIYSKSYRLNRLLAFTDIWKYSQTYSYQIVQSLLSFAAGGLTGAGIGQGKQKLLFLPEAHTDFIFAVIGEELGFIGAFLVVICFLVIALRGFYIAIKLSENLYLCYLACGMTLFITFEALFNIAVSVCLAPPKGLPLPFLSYGGTAMLTYMASMGILLNLSRRARE